MLEDAHLMRKRGIDVVIGFVEPHKRADTEAMIRDLEVIPQRAIPYRSVVLHEMDLDAILRGIRRSALWTSWRTRMCRARRTASGTRTYWSCWTRA
jgi:hypothetical protein